jgi:hypothetical protein
VSDQPEAKRTRRAKRRAEQAEQTVASEAPEQAATEESEAASESARPKRKSKTKSEGTEEISDRNRRLREKAAAERRSKRAREREEAPVRGLAASEIVDDALSRSTQAVANFTKKYFGVIQWLLVAALVGGVGYQIYSYRHGKQTAKVSDALAKAVDRELGRIVVEKPPEAEGWKGVVNPVPEFKTEQERTKAASEAYREVTTENSNNAPAVLAKLGLAGTAYDAAKYDDAQKLYEEVKTSSIAAQDVDIKSRAIEGIGMSLEAKGAKDAALKAYHELENLEVPAFSMLGLYHQARVLFMKGDRDKSKDLIKRAREKLDKQPAEERQQYLDYATGQLLKVLDPAEFAKSAEASAYTPEQLEALKKQIMEDPSKLSGMLKDLGKGVPAKVPVPQEPAPQPAPSNKP